MPQQQTETHLLMTKLEKTSNLIQKLMEQLSENDRKLTVLQTKFDGLKERFEEITRILHGNGGGIEVKTAIVERELKSINKRLESLERQRADMARENRRGVIAIFVAIGTVILNAIFWLFQKLTGS